MTASMFQAQRAMRQKYRQALKRGLFAVLDIGAWKTACFVLRHDEDMRADPLAWQGNLRLEATAVSASEGVSRGEIHDMRRAEKVIRTVIHRAQKEVGECIDHVFVTFGGGNPVSAITAGSTELGGERTREADIADALAACPLPDLGPGRQLLHAQPLHFWIDNRTGLGDPLGQTGQELGVEMHLLAIDLPVFDGVLGCVRNCDLDLCGLTAAGQAAGLGVLTEEERRLGAAVVDIGAGTADIALFFRQHMIHAASVPLGGALVTSDIAYAFDIPFAEAERLKTRFGGCIATSRDDLDEIPLGVEGEWEGERRTTTRSELIGVIAPRMAEILEAVRERLEAIEFYAMPSQRIVLTGGASQLPGLDRMAARILGDQVRLGVPIRIARLPENARGPEFAALVGLVHHVMRPSDEWWDFEGLERRGKGPVRRIVQWLASNW